ncbi:MAG: hypothetical protein JEZ11_08160 [Desulfobacterales bacterium]|nr:hypothetical protein [Desulfobacterales bacterium]
MKQKMAGLIDRLRENGHPSREEFETAASELLAWRERNGLKGLWNNPPLMITATLDDAMGHGLALIHPFAEAAGLQVVSLGLLQPPETIIGACRTQHASFLGLTVLQFDTEEALGTVCRGLPRQTVCVAGGPVFRADPELAARAGVHHVARDAAAFWEILLQYA